MSFQNFYNAQPNGAQTKKTHAPFDAASSQHFCCCSSEQHSSSPATAQAAELKEKHGANGPRGAEEDDGGGQ